MMLMQSGLGTDPKDFTLNCFNAYPGDLRVIEAAAIDLTTIITKKCVLELKKTLVDVS